MKTLCTRLIIIGLTFCSMQQIYTVTNQCTKAYDTCWCDTETGASFQGICFQSSTDKNKLYCDCTDVLNDDEIKARQKQLFDTAPAELFCVPEVPLAERKAKGAQIKAQLKQKLDLGKITYYSTEIPIGARLNTDYTCSQATPYSCQAFTQLLKDGKLGTAYLLEDGTIHPSKFKLYNQAISEIYNLIQGGEFIKGDIQQRKGWARTTPQKYIDLATNPCTRFIDLLQRKYKLMPVPPYEDAITKHEKQAINAICAAPAPQETKKNNDPCVCGDERQPQTLKPGLCQVNRRNSTDTLSCHCQD